MTPGGGLARFAERLRGLDGVHKPIVAWSGGADSTALLVLCAASGIEPTAVHIDHGLRPESAAQARFLYDIAAKIGVALDTRSAHVVHGSNLEARARTARYDALEAARVEHNATAILVAHTSDDQAETVLLNLLRGSGSAGLAGMRLRNGLVIRPALELRRADMVQICALAGIAPIHDSMNDDPAYRRVFLRREVIPQLQRTAGRDLVPVLSRQAAIMREESDLLDDLAADLLEGAGAPPRASHLAAAPPALARRALRVWLGAPPPDQRVIEEVLEVVRGARRSAMVPRGRIVERAGDRLSISSIRDAHEQHEVSDSERARAILALPGRVRALGTDVEAWVSAAPPTRWPDGGEVCVIDADRAGREAVVRAVRPGDRLHPLGLGGSKRAVRALAERGIPRDARSRRAVVVASDGAAVAPGEPLWLVGYGVDDRVRVTRSTRRYLWMSARPVEALATPDWCP